ncbi:ATP-dependent nuclease [Paraburkholderia caledonica]|uniref:ATP-dependent nuclease n=1 Tax=Paraburkholderia caledonica TaxID=134536 RepID=UPI000B48D1B7|nr:hypothetical protein BWU74_32070 [Burkholderia sp. Bk]
MQITHFRITNFRSIVDTGWCPFSRDGVTVLVGQNESGKTSVLDALATTFSARDITADDLRSGAPYPHIQVRFKCDVSELESVLARCPQEHIQTLREFWDRCSETGVLDFSWKPNKKDSKKPFAVTVSLLDADELAKSIAAFPVDVLPRPQPATDPTATPAPPGAPNDGGTQSGPIPLTVPVLGQAIYSLAPEFILFSEREGMLPNEIELDDAHAPTGSGAVAASNYLYAAEIDLPKMLAADRRTRESFLLKANSRLTKAFNSFWSQTIGKGTQLSLTCDIEYHEASDAPKAGKPYLVFWISDGHTQLYPSQRSQGVRWFVSFFLQLKAAKREYENVWFLLDEPGANLHSKAQADVLKLINDLRHEIPIVYSTHSPHLIEYEHLHRIHAVQRLGDEEDSPTTILDAHQLGAASSDTLSPVLTAMGTDLASQQTIQRRNNVLVEEISGFYYFAAFWKLTQTKQVAHFIASTGVNKLAALANMFLGWGLSFITVVDDDNQGRGVYKDLMRDLYGDDAKIADQYVVKLKGCDGIEDVFSTSDFKRHVLKDEAANIQQKNSEFLKRAGRSKPILALEFKLAVDNGHIRLADLDEATQNAITAIIDNISGKLANPMAEAA